ncbi:fatty acid oxidation complex subunit alpha FadB [Pelomonas sp. KK5]|uniref:fatty acid oxidation complex subunit alpha FadB n=1 Tax=Pelomonas sp. KK5 TaxID=1855730 RepID=UPI00097BA9C6|nr:fatty acid oxidation complex subunit alpha FadB [Pelomonas sp. KK5]
MYSGKSLRLQALGDGLLELVFDREGDTINKLDQRTVAELKEVTALIAADRNATGLLVTSAKPVFIVGADITEFGKRFKLDEAVLAADVRQSNEIFNAFEDLPIPSVVAVNGYALGGGLEFVLANALRVMSTAAQVGVPEVKLGLYPGFGGTVRLPRVADAQLAIDWVSSGKPAGAPAALAGHVVDEVCEPEELRDQALALLRRAVTGDIDWRARQQRKREALPLAAATREALFTAALAKVQASSPKHQPAALIAVQVMAEAATMHRADALTAEARGFARVAKTQAADAMVQTFLSEQQLKKLFKRHAKQGRAVKQLAVVGAGIMGGGIAYTSALRGVPVRMSDIAQGALDLGIGEAQKLLGKLVRSGRKSDAQAGHILGAITPQLDHAGFDEADLVIEAVVENLAVKQRVLADLEGKVRPDAVLASNTSSLRIDDIAAPLARPENFVGMHFFNPVPVMPLVEVIRGSRSSDVAVSTAVGQAVAMGKTPIVVKDCPGFLVNRILTAYMRGFLQLVADGADFERVDRVMEAFGWPMGPAYLQDVVGMDVGSHVTDVISAGYPERMPPIAHDPLKLMVRERRFGQKTGLGFYRYETDPQGKPRRSAAEDTRALLAAVQPGGPREFSDEEIVERLMLPLVLEAARALEDGVVATPVELDMALLLGIGFPAYLGGALKYADWLGLAHVVDRCARYEALGAAYHPTERMRRMAAADQRYYDHKDTQA